MASICWLVTSILEEEYLYLFHVYQQGHWTICVVPCYIFTQHKKNADIQMPNLSEHVNRVCGSPITALVDHLSVDVHTVILYAEFKKKKKYL